MAEKKEGAQPPKPPQPKGKQAPPPPWQGANTSVHQQSILEENNKLLQETRKMIKHIRTLQAIKLTITILFLVVPIVTAVLVLPRFLSNTFITLEDFSQNAFGIEGSIFDLLKDVSVQEVAEPQYAEDGSRIFKAVDEGVGVPSKPLPLTE